MKIKNVSVTIRLTALGVSLGGIMLGNYLRKVEDQAQGKLVAAFLVSVCWDTFEGCNSIEKWGLNLLLNRHLAHCLVDTFKTYKHLFDRFGHQQLKLICLISVKIIDLPAGLSNDPSSGRIFFFVPSSNLICLGL